MCGALVSGPFTQSLGLSMISAGEIGKQGFGWHFYVTPVTRDWQEKESLAPRALVSAQGHSEQLQLAKGPSQSTLCSGSLKWSANSLQTPGTPW